MQYGVVERGVWSRRDKVRGAAQPSALSTTATHGATRENIEQLPENIKQLVETRGVARRGSNARVVHEHFGTGSPPAN